MILVDTSIWIRSSRNRWPEEARELDALLVRDEVAVTGMVLAEVLQGARTESDFERLLDKMGALQYLDLSPASWHRAGFLSFQLARRGLPTPLTDLVIAAVALEHDVPVYAADEHFNRIPGLKLHGPQTPDSGQT